MDTTLIETYLINLTSSKQKILLDMFSNIQSVLENAVISSIFSYPGVTVNGTPVCSLHFEGKKIRMRFFQRELFGSFAEEFTELDCGNTSILISSPDDVLSAPVERLLRCTALAANVDSEFKRKVERTSSGFYDSVTLSPRRKKKENGNEAQK